MNFSLNNINAFQSVLRNTVRHLFSQSGGIFFALLFLVGFSSRVGAQQRPFLSSKFSLLAKWILTAAVFVFCLHGKAQLVVNEFSQGSGGFGFREYVELVVAQPKTCTKSTADIRGWIIDDHNGWYGYIPSSIAPGHLRFAYNLNWANVPCGAIIVLYFQNDKNPKLPADDPTDANNDLVYILPFSSSYIETNTTDPPGSNPPANPYASSTYTAGSNHLFDVTGLYDGGDAIILTNPSNLTTASWSILYGSGVLSSSGVSPTVTLGVGVGAGQNAYLTDGQFANASSWAIGSVAGGNETPGAANTATNQAWIQSLRTLPTISTTVNSPSICTDDAPAILNATPGTAGSYVYIWTVPSGVSDPGNISSFTTSSAGNYSVKITEGDCT
ncbi:MAG: hypothetical protein M3O67_10185, partial [Bacteroidota bacterium]|nr:hypothetical protein [Bacteroidota bacterium]